MIRLASGKQYQSCSSRCCCSDTNMTCNPGRPATEHFTGRVFGLPSHLFFPHHTALLQGLRAQLTPAKLPSHGHALLSSMQLESDRILTSSGKVTCWPIYYIFTVLSACYLCDLTCPAKYHLSVLSSLYSVGVCPQAPLWIAYACIAV